MKRNKQSWLANITLAASAVMLAVPASASITYNDGDIVLAVRATGGVGNTQTYLADIGNVSQFTTTSSISNINVLNSLGNIATDLGNTFGTAAGSTTDWTGRSDLSWGLFGANSLSPSSIWASKAETTLGTAPSAWSALGTTNRNTTRNQITSVTATFAGATSTGNSVGYLQTNVSNTSSYNYQVSNGATAFGNVSGLTKTNFEGNSASGITSTALDLFAFTGSTTPTDLGAFTINSSGVLSFTGSAVSAAPEPSRALFGMIGLAAVFLRRRRPDARA